MLETQFVRDRCYVETSSEPPQKFLKPGLRLEKAVRKDGSRPFSQLFCSSLHLREKAGSVDGGLGVAERSDSWECPNSGPQDVEELVHSIGPIDLPLVHPE